MFLHKVPQIHNILIFSVTIQSQNQVQRQKSQSVENLRPYHVIKRRSCTSELLPKQVPSHIDCPDYASQVEQRVSEKTLFKAEEAVVWTEEEINLVSQPLVFYKHIL